MSSHHTHEKGSAHVIIISILIVALLGALGFIFWQNFLNKSQDSKSTESESSKMSAAKSDTTTSATNTQVVADGIINGSFLYPSEGMPPDLEAHAVNLDTNKEYSTKEHINSAEYTYRVGFKLSVPAGRYYLYATLPSSPRTKAYYNEFIRCGTSVTCKDYTKIEVKVESGKQTDGAVVGDWYNT